MLNCAFPFRTVALLTLLCSLSSYCPVRSQNLPTSQTDTTLTPVPLTPTPPIHHNISLYAPATTPTPLSGSGLHPARHPVDIITPLAPNEVVRGAITGYGWQYYTIDVPVQSFLDVILIVDRGIGGSGESDDDDDDEESESESESEDSDESRSSSDDGSESGSGVSEDGSEVSNGAVARRKGRRGSASTSCEGWVMYLDVSATKQTPDERYIDTGNVDFLKLISSAFVQVLQHSILCNLFASARVSTKEADPTKWWIMIQTRGGTAAYEDVTCQYRVYANTHPRMSFFWVGTLLSSVFMIWMAAWYYFTLRSVVLVPYPITLHSFLLLAPGKATSWVLFKVCRPIPGLLTTAYTFFRGWLQRRRAYGEMEHEGSTVRGLRHPRPSEGDDLRAIELGPRQSSSPAPLIAGTHAEEVRLEIPSPEDHQTQETHRRHHHHHPHQPIHEASRDALLEVPAPIVTASASGSHDRVSNASKSRPGLARSGSHSADITTEEVNVCRICREDGSSEPLIEPCGCQGSVSFVHASCLDRWREASIASGRHENALRCEICRQEFNIVRTVPSLGEHLWKLTKMAVRKVTIILGWTASFLLFIYLSAWFTNHTVARWTCLAPYETIHLNVASMGIHEWLVGTLFYGLYATHVYLCGYLQWLQWLSHRCRHNLRAEDWPLYTRRNALGFALQWVHLLVFLIGLGYWVKFLLYLISDSLIWSWDLSLILGIITFLFLLVLVLAIAVLVISFRRWWVWWYATSTLAATTVMARNERTNAVQRNNPRNNPQPQPQQGAAGAEQAVAPAAAQAAPAAGAVNVQIDEAD